MSDEPSRVSEADKPSTGPRSISGTHLGFVDSQARNVQTFSIEQAKHELRAEEKRHQLDEIAKNNASRRRHESVGFYTVLTIVVVGLGVSLLIGLMSDNSDTRNWAQGIFTLILGSVLGALAGYFTGKNGQ